MNNRGLTLIEVIISALILSIAVGGILLVFTTEKGVVSHTGRRVQAMDFTRQTLEQLKNAVGADTWPAAGDLSSGTHNSEGFLTLPGDFGPGGRFAGAGRSYTVNDVLDSGDIIYKSVTVTVDWSEPTE
ncbi:unnamed protein product [marine sediment metagenome]|uniref:Prepilin-type N-terminal cleavage/methylation domain-containing protein n=1 Tax=marine sediment metagenome TaxID=412755 RepID=X0WU10_9ZZZZ